MISLAVAVLFALSLLPGRTPACLRFAGRVSGGILPDGAAAYCRRLTWVWTGILLTNAAATSLVTLHAAWGVWRFAASLLLSAAVVAGTFAVERRVRNRRFSVSFSTSGSTAAPKPVVKTFESLAKETAFHRARLADTLARKPLFLSTVEPHHMYGTLWRVMLPKAAGCPVDPDVILSPETLLAKMRSADAVFLVTTPSFLARFTAYAEAYDVPQNCVEITTSGALLTADVSAAAKRVFGRAPQEIFGSTETGGVAWRRQEEGNADAALWRVFDPVTVRTAPDGRLVVASPFSFRRRYTLGDGVTLTPDRRAFSLHGRLDRLVKIAEHRVSLPAYEEVLKSLPDVADAALCPLEGPHGSYLGAVVVRTPDAPPLPAKPGLALRQRLLPLFPKGTVPRRYRFVHDLPRNAQGKVRTAALRRILLSGLTEPHVAHVVRTETSWAADFTFDPAASYFRGHFPSFAVLPGVVQLGLARHFAEQAFLVDAPLKAVKKMKFSHAIVPGAQIRFTLTRQSDTVFAYEYKKGDVLCSSAVLCF